MTDMIRWDPISEMMSLRHEMDRIFENAFRRSPLTWLPAREVAMDVLETDEAFIVTASLPGINPDDLEITLENMVLTIKGEYKEETQPENSQYYLRERRFGKFSRSISLPVPVDENAIEATYKDGVLNLHLPKSEEAKPKRIPVHTADEKVVIER